MVRPARWSDAEVAVALDPRLSIAEAAARVGRTPGAVKSKRYQHRLPRVQVSDRKRRWTSAELGVLRDESLTAVQVAARLGRSIGAVHYARNRYVRPVPDHVHGSLTGWHYGCRCDRCRDFIVQYRAETVDPAATAARSRALHYRQQAATLPTAHHHGAPWTAEDIAVACDLDIAVEDAALQLGRSAKAVYGARAKFHPDGTLRRGFQTPRSGAPYSDAELAVALDRRLTMAQAAERLGRSVRSIEKTRLRFRGHP